MSMPLLYNIEKFNDTVIIQCSVSMYTEEFTQYLPFSIAEGATRPVSSDLKTHFVRPFELPWRAPLSQCTCSTIALCMSIPTEYDE